MLLSAKQTQGLEWVLFITESSSLVIESNLTKLFINGPSLKLKVVEIFYLNVHFKSFFKTVLL